MGGFGSGNSPASRRNLRPVKPGQVLNPKGRPSAGVAVKELWNEMAGWPLARLQAAADDEKAPVARRAAAKRWVAALDNRESLEQIVNQTDGRPRQSVDVKMSGGLAHTVHDAMERMRGDPAAAAAAERLADLLYGNDGDGITD